MPLTPAQCRAARALLDWTQDKLTEGAEVSRGTIRGFESGQHALHRRRDAPCPCSGGVTLVEADRDGGQGVRLIEPADSVATDAENATAFDKSTLQQSGGQVQE